MLANHWTVAGPAGLGGGVWKQIYLDWQRRLLKKCILTFFILIYLNLNTIKKDEGEGEREKSLDVFDRGKEIAKPAPAKQ